MIIRWQEKQTTFKVVRKLPGIVSANLSKLARETKVDGGHMKRQGKMGFSVSQLPLFGSIFQLKPGQPVS
jgi:hypothetical protein